MPGRQYAFVLARVARDGTWDAAFDAKANGPFDGRVRGIASALALQTDGKVVVGGEHRFLDESGELALERHLADGSLDPTFGSAGRVFAPCNGASCRMTDLLVQPWDGKILVGALLSREWDDAQIGHHSLNELLVVRFTPDGQLDATFGLGGFFRSPVRAHNGSGGWLALQANGKILLVGSADPSGADHAVPEVLDGGPDADPHVTHYAVANSDVAVARVLPRGVADDTFGDHGSVLTAIGRQDQGFGPVLSPDGKRLDVVARSMTQSGTGQPAYSLALLRYSLGD